MNTHRLLTLLFASAVLFTAVADALALQSPRSVTAGLRVLNQVVGHTGRLVQAKDYQNVGGEHHEFVEGAAMLREGLRGEPTTLTTKVEPALTAAIEASAALGKLAAESQDAGKIAAAHADFAAKVKAVIELFPEDVRPKPRQKKQ